ncbi:twin-arginine translocation signal domain-containing protein [Qingshengfaniella alkalisoli]|uniref:Twin-arginine translocation signal domain-containing protein n=1 Tax=Qingshengfaniella alkalisoli TaxID=2599296 RepID=A0A5B8J623_9RHOB|nr:twin-arginine translocation signal domain-containing protein [Qingshengfaniella alkalisoli]QDY69790.1 twin-arginine translocation signal domain-containing protein [Qingshengfaniella alkalisoli]
MADQNHKSDNAHDRRAFLKLAGLAPVAAGAATLGASDEAEASGTNQSDGYRETDHIKTYYDLARF